MATRFREIDGEEYLRKGQALAYIGNQSGQYKGDKWLYARVCNGRLTKYEIDGKPYFKRSELDALLRPQVVEQHAPAYSEQDYMTIKEVANSVHLSKGYISRLVREGEIKAVNLSGKVGRGAVIRIYRGEYTSWLRKREQAASYHEKIGATAR